ncbi:hypothetical protein WAX88_16020 [Photobacterium damselae subsp. damselae]|uniref:hypothetical protein n=1 Tax=Photobacterium damselae TaxID=38293 RepID=UPI00311AFF9C
MKRLFFATAVLMSFSSIADIRTESWDADSMVVTNYDGQTSVLSFVSYANRISIALSTNSSACYAYENNAKPYGVIKVNDVGVKFVEQCTDEGIIAIMPYTKKGNNYIINELKSKKTVKFEDLSFSTAFKTKGFIAVYNKYKKFSNDKGI